MPVWAEPGAATPGLPSGGGRPAGGGGGGGGRRRPPAPVRFAGVGRAWGSPAWPPFRGPPPPLR